MGSLVSCSNSVAVYTCIPGGAVAFSGGFSIEMGFLSEGEVCVFS